MKREANDNLSAVQSIGSAEHSVDVDGHRPVSSRSPSVSAYRLSIGAATSTIVQESDATPYARD